MTAFLGYGAVAVGLLFDLGLPWHIWHPMIFWNPRSPLFEVAWCVMLYLTVLALEVAPSQAGKEAATLELVIGASGLDFTLSGELGFRLPRTSWPINELFLDVYLPQVFHYTWRGGSLSPVESSPPAPFSHRVPVPGSRHSFHQFLVTRSAPDLTLGYAVNLEGHYYRGEN